MITIYGSMLCKDCVTCCEELDKAGISYDYRDFSDDLQNLKTFLSIRDSESVFRQVKEDGGIGIPCICREDGFVTLDWRELI